MPTNFPTGVESRGLPVANDLITTGTTRYVDSNNGSASYDGKTPGKALVTIDAAINASSAGDAIYVLEGHAESVANATTIIPDVNGIKIVGLGTGARRPTITMTATASNIPVSGTDVRLENLLITTSGTVDVTSAITVTGDDSHIVNVEIRESAATSQFVTGLFFNDADYATAAGIRMTGSEKLEIVDCDIVGNFQGSANAVGAILSITTLNIDVRIHHNRVENRDGTSEAGIVFVGTDTGFCYENFIAVPTGDFAQGLIADTAMRQFNNFVVDVAQERGAPVGTASA
mgnify:CR=1 FL=1